MKFTEALKTVLCDSEKGIDYNKIVVGKNFELLFIPFTNSDCSMSVHVYYSSHRGKVYNQYMLGSIPVMVKYFEYKDYVEEEELNKFLKKEYLFENEEVEIKPAK